MFRATPRMPWFLITSSNVGDEMNIVEAKSIVFLTSADIADYRSEDIKGNKI
jgi:hypothetical protein